MNCRDIIKKWLEDNGYDGLYHDNDCGCKLDDLMPCDEQCGYCEPGYEKKCESGEYDYIIGPKERS